MRRLTAQHIDQAVQLLEAGRLVAFPTETVYGLGADAGRPEAVSRIFEAKGRPTGHPLIVHIASDVELERFGRDIGPAARKLATAFWPGPLTLVVERGSEVAAETVGGLDTVGLRVPDHPLTLDLLARFGRGLAGPSANRFGSVSPTTADHVISDYPSDSPSGVDAVLDGGPCSVGVESTIIDVTGDAPILLRPGGISVVEIEAATGLAVADGRSGPARASGMLGSHYAPTATVEIVDDRSVWERLAQLGTDRLVGVIGPGEYPHPLSWTLPADADGFGARLYATLRDADRAGADHLLVVPPRTGRLVDAVLDRLAKAAAPRKP